jgi:hypothetical protein
LSSEIQSLLIGILTATMASSGFWAWLMSRQNKKDSTTKIIMGLAYDKATDLGVKYINRGWISKDELEDYQKYLVVPYMELGGNGVVERIFKEVLELPLTNVNVKDLEIDRRTSK